MKKDAWLWGTAEKKDPEKDVVSNHFQDISIYSYVRVLCSCVRNTTSAN